MSENTLIKPDYVFEISWEVCNKVGGIYTVISTKALTLVDELHDNFIFIGPDISKETYGNPEFIEDRYLFRSWRENAESEGLRFKIGRWNIAGNPIAILVEFTPYFAIKDKIFADFWTKYQLDSLQGHWDYVEPVMFGYAAAKIIESFYNYNCTSFDKIIGHFHEWMTGSGILYLKDAVPQIGTLFTTHATAVARSIAGNGLHLYKDLEHFNGDTMAKEFGMVSKQSIEKISAHQADCFTTVSEITAKECTQLLEKDVDFVTPNGFEDSFVPNSANFEEKRDVARKKLIEVAEAILNQKISDDALLIANSGRYEFKNKGIDLFIDSLGVLNNNAEIKKEIIAFILVPANHAGPRKEVAARLGNTDFNAPISEEYLSHALHDAEYDPSLNRIRVNNLRNNEGSKVKVIMVPVYLNGSDGIFNIEYYDLLIGFDLTVFPSYYEPWGYTPLESIAFHIPTVTTTLAGFGMWVKSISESILFGAEVIVRTDENDQFVIEEIAKSVVRFQELTNEEVLAVRQKSFDLSRTALWKNLISNYQSAYSLALEKVADRADLFISKQLPEAHATVSNFQIQKPTWKKVFIKSEIPAKIANLQKLSRNLWWSWDFDAKELFEMVNKKLWEKVNYNPVFLLESLSYDQLLKLEKNKEFINKLNFVVDKFNNYILRAVAKPKEQIAYFSMEFGLHDSVKIFSGGLGILAGDYLKEASDSNKNIVGVGLLYRYGYFTQNLSLNGEQMAFYSPQKFTNIAVNPVRDDEGNWMIISLALPGRTLFAKVWSVEVGRITLYLMDTDIEENAEGDRSITHQLYGGDWENRFKQELLLGVGGIRLLDRLGLNPDLYHCNEGHAAFIGLERLRKLVQDHKFNFYEAVEIVRASSLFTTHTPVPAGHDAFTEDILRAYISHYPDRLNISWETFIGLGRINPENGAEKFSMSVLATKLSQEMNGVSRIHGRVSREMFNKLWDGFFPDELYIDYVTNGVHFPTWTAKRWQDLYYATFGEEFLTCQSDSSCWKKIHEVPDAKIWEIRQAQRTELIDFMKVRLMDNLTKRQENPKMIFETINSFNDKALTIGFARRFATYKRAYLLFTNIERLAKIVNNPNHPVQFVFAGKAHPQDKAGQDLIKHIVEISKMPEFIGKITFLENYDMELAKKLVQGVDVWLNTPTRPLEASGTSGEKAVMNGVINLSVLDGWWAEGYKPGAGWALKEENTYENDDIQNELDAETIYNLFENEISPMFYNRNSEGIPVEWVSYVKNTISEIAPHFTMKRMVDDYHNKYYHKMIERSKKLIENDYYLVRHISQWKKRISRSWESIEILSFDVPNSTLKPMLLGEKFKAEIVIDLNEIAACDIGVEILFGQKVMDEVKSIVHVEELKITNTQNHIVTYSCEFPTTRTGVYDFAFRIFPKSKLLPHKQDFPLIKWV
ncbi:MAG: alpha-glucan family phosphorylase [Bacteroidetes bacterium]|nr:alpha-glucan family phosphorylase [Bacteroidota bacterium]